MIHHVILINVGSKHLHLSSSSAQSSQKQKLILMSHVQGWFHNQELLGSYLELQLPRVPQSHQTLHNQREQQQSEEAWQRLVFTICNNNNQSEISITMCQQIRDQYHNVSTNQRSVSQCVNQSEISVAYIICNIITTLELRLEEEEKRDTWLTHCN